MRIILQYILMNALLAAFINLGVKLVLHYDTGFWGVFLLVNCLIILMSINANLKKVYDES